ncbi:MAG: bifunctional chorismate mutase/prephenate dehydrogenase [Deltaproteobacteria bacterium]|nr:bifunctional chorismate mutase/prephenate dehydrogenase [Deltaproteobacteria bacterium]
MEKETQKSGCSKNPADTPAVSGSEPLESLRLRIDEIDLGIIKLLAERQAEVDRMVSLKKAQNLPVHHPAREENMVSERRSLGADMGLDPDHLEEMFRAIMRRSRVNQTETISRKGVRPGATVLIVGGTRGMGRYFLNWFKRSGYNTRAMGSRDWDNIGSLCSGIDLALISVPIESTEAVVERIAAYLPQGCVLADLTSIKERPMKAMMEAHKGPVIGLHPLFGPTTSSMDKQIVVTTPGRDDEACRWLNDQLIAWGAVLVQSDPKQHDDIMAVVQALRHFATFIFGRFLFMRRIDLFRTLEFSSPIYRLELGMVGRLFAQDPALYSEIIFASPERRALIKDYIVSITEGIDMVEKGDKEEFNRQFRQIAEWFGPFSEQAMRESTFLIEKLIERF